MRLPNAELAIIDPKKIRDYLLSSVHPVGRFKAHFFAVRSDDREVAAMKHKLLDTVVLARDLPERGLCSGDLGAIVEVYEPDGVEVEFVTASGRTEAMVTLKATDVRPVGDADLIAVRRLERTA